MTRAIDAAARFIHVSETESLSNAFQANAFRANAFQANAGLLYSGLWRGHDCDANSSKTVYAVFGSQCGRPSMLTAAYRPIELEDLSEDSKISEDSKTINRPTYRSREFKRIDAVPA